MDRFIQHMGRLHISTITLAELYVWVFRREASPRRLVTLQTLLQEVVVVDVSPAVSRTFGELQAARLDRGRPIPEMDLLIAATALVFNLTLVTHNTKDYEDIPGLAITDWLK